MAIRFRRRTSPYLWGGVFGIVLIVLVVSTFINSDSNNITISVGGAVLAESPVERNTSINVFFCPEDDCEGELYNEIINSRESIHCAMYDLDLKQLVEGLLNQSSKGLSVRVVVDDNNYELLEGISFVKEDTTSQLMHDKFCIFDERRVFTGSFNPTFNGAYKNNNNMLIIESQILADNYADEFKELWAGTFGDGRRVSNPSVYLEGVLVENYFCPEDWCANKIMKKLFEAEESIYFMAFSFTHDGISEMLINKSREGIEVKGIMEKTQNNQYAEYDKLVDAGINVQWDEKNTKGVMHHKTFIIDGEIVITGSMNPTKGGDDRNDENILIIKDKGIASEFLSEFNKLS